MSQKLSLFGIKSITLEKIINICSEHGNLFYDASRFSGIKNKINNNITYKVEELKKGGILFYLPKANDKLADILEKSMSIGASAIFLPKDDFDATGLDQSAYPVILLDNFKMQTSSVYGEIKSSCKGIRTVAITGSLGKTTTTKFIASIMESPRTYDCNGKFHKEGSNRNGFRSISASILRFVNPVFKTYIQEIGAGFPDHVKMCANMVRPDVFVLLNVRNHHLNTYKTFDAIFEDKTSIDDFMPENGTVIANFDEKPVREHKFKHKVISFGIDCETDVDFRGANVVQNEEYLEMDVLHNGEVSHLKVRILGTHNGYNLLAAFACGKTLGKSDAEIITALQKYRSVGVRQNLENIGGRFFYLDCYNASKDSIISAAATVAGFPVKPGNKRIGVIGGENKLGEMAEAVSFETGVELAKTGLDYICLQGTSRTDQEGLDIFGDAASVKKGLDAQNYVNYRLCTTMSQVSRYLKENFNVGDIACFKGIYRLHMPIIIDNTYGSSISFHLPNYRKDFIKVQDGNWSGNAINLMKAMELTKCKSAESHITLPEYIKEFKVFRCGDHLFEGAKGIKHIEFGTVLRNIGEYAFAGCSGITELDVPENVGVIEGNAFYKCTGLKKVTIADGLVHIGKQAFANCNNLETVRIPSTVGKIEDGAFENCTKLVICCEAGSYACEWAVRNGIACRTED